MTTYTYTFDGTDTDWGTIPVPAGHPALTQVAGSWRRQGNKPVVSDPAIKSILAATAGLGDVDMVADVSPDGGDSLYFRVQDAANFYRVRVRYFTREDPAQARTITEYKWIDSNTGEVYWAEEARNVMDAQSFQEPNDRTRVIRVYEYVREIAVEEYTNGAETNRHAATWIEKTQDTDGNLISGAEGTGPLPTRLRVRVVGTGVEVFTNNATDPYLWAIATKYLDVARHGIGRSPETNAVNSPGTSGLDNLTIESLDTVPNAPILTGPANGSSIDRLVAQRFTWQPSDPDAGDTPTKADLRYRLIGATAWTTVTQPTPSPFWDAPVATFAAGDHEWQARTYDRRGQVGPWSSSSFFTASTQSSPVSLTSPSNGGTVSNEHLVTWSSPGQTAYRVRRVADAAGSADPGTVYWDSGIINSATTRSHLVTFDTTNRTEHVQVQVLDGGLWTAWSSARVLVSFAAPATPLVRLVAVGATTITFSYANPIPGTGQNPVSYNEVWVNDGEGEKRLATNLPNSQGGPVLWTYYTPKSNLDYWDRVRVVAVGENGSTASAGPENPQGV